MCCLLGKTLALLSPTAYTTSHHILYLGFVEGYSGKWREMANLNRSTLCRFSERDQKADAVPQKNKTWKTLRTTLEVVKVYFFSHASGVALSVGC